VSALLISLKAFSCSSPHTTGSYSSPVYGFIKGFGQERVIGDLDPAEPEALRNSLIF
jgi:hypothetical protein